MKFPRRRVIAGAAGALAVAPFGASAQAAYPTKPIRFILPFPPGSGTDIGARITAKQITDMTGQPVIVDNRAGGNGLIAAQAAATSLNDGYTVFITTMTTQAVNLSLYKKLPYDPQADFIPVMRFGLSPMLCVVRNVDDQPKTLAELVERARKASAPLNFASGNTSSMVAGSAFLKQIGAKGTHVSYKGTPQGLTDLLAGQVDFFFPDLTPSVPLVQQGKLRALGVTGVQRIGSLPDVPTMTEAGVPIELVTWSGAFLPAGTPRPIVDKLNELLNKALASPEYQELSKRSGTSTAPNSPEAFAAFVKSEVKLWGDAVRAAGIEPQ
jgi:tripartite-type tricarboxylate transporter receptor subunit TctC